MQLTNLSITQASNAIQALDKPENIDIITEILRHMGKPLILSFIVFPAMIMIILGAFFDFSGRQKSKKVIVTFTIFLIISETMGLFLFLLLNIYKVPYIN